MRWRIILMEGKFGFMLTSKSLIYDNTCSHNNSTQLKAVTFSARNIESPTSELLNAF